MSSEDAKPNLNQLYEENRIFQIGDKVQFKEDGASWTNGKITDDNNDGTYGVLGYSDAKHHTINKTNLQYLFEINDPVIVCEQSGGNEGSIPTCFETTIINVPSGPVPVYIVKKGTSTDDVLVSFIAPNRTKLHPLTSEAETSAAETSAAETSAAETSAAETSAAPTNTSASALIEGMGMFLTDVKLKPDGTFESVGDGSYIQEDGKKYKILAENGKLTKKELISKETALKQGGAPRRKTIQRHSQQKNRTRKYKYLRRYLV